MNSGKLQIFIFLFVGLCNLAFAAPAAAISLRTETEVNRPTVKLSDVFEGLPPEIDCDIARAPAPGKSITYDSNVIAHLVHQYKLDWAPGNIGDHTTITTASTKITSDDIRAAVIQKVRALEVGGDIDVLFDNHAQEVILPADRPPNFVLNNFNYDGINKRFRADLVADSFAGPVTLPVIGHIAIRQNVPVLAKRLDAGTIISASDIDWISVSDDHLAGAVINAESLVGRELKRDAEGGKPIHENDVIAPRYVVRGTLVTMKTETPFMTVTAQGRALQDGKLGDTVRVLNTDSSRTIEGIVDSPGVVRVRTTRIVASADADGKQE